VKVPPGQATGKPLKAIGMPDIRLDKHFFLWYTIVRDSLDLRFPKVNFYPMGYKILYIHIYQGKHHAGLFLAFAGFIARENGRVKDFFEIFPKIH
jgi:hypothetical protein